MSSVDTIERLSRDLAKNPDLIDQLLVDRFDLDAVLSGVGELGYNMSEGDIEAYLKRKFPTGGAMADMTYYVEGEGDNLRQLSPEEVEAVGGGVTVVAAVVSVVVAAYAAVIAVGAAVIFIGAFAFGVSEPTLSRE